MRDETTYYNDQDEEIQLRTIKVVCWRCDGEGSHDCWRGGMTTDEMDEQGPEFLDDYMSGMYDAVCEECHGLRVLDEVDETANDPRELALWREQQQQLADMRAEEAAERAMGA